MRSKKNFAICMLAAVISMAFCGCQGEPKTFEVSTGEDGVITVTAKNADKDSGGDGYVTLETDEQVVKVEADLEDDTSVEIIITDEADGQNHGQKVVIGDEDIEFQMPAGEYMIQFVAHEGATGSLSAYVE